jgi:predicted nucleic-acid-binding protein
MIKKYICDTNVIIRYLVRDNEDLFNKANEFFNDVIGGNKKVIIEQAVFTEVVFVLSSYYKVPRDEIAEALSQLLQYKDVTVDHKDTSTQYLLESLKLYKTTNLHIVDCLIISKAKYSASEIFSFDQELVRQYS